jgi:hypothetical protein
MSHRAGESGEITRVTTISIQDKQCGQVTFDFCVDILNVGGGARQSTPIGVLWRGSRIDYISINHSSSHSRHKAVVDLPQSGEARETWQRSFYTS